MFFDLHTHPSLKSYLTRGKVNLWGFVDSSILSDNLDSECNLRQMKKAGVKIAIAALHPIERPFCSPQMLKGVLPFFSPLDGSFLREIENGKISYYTMLKEELSLFDKYQTFKDESIQFVNSSNDISDDKVNIVFAVEGAHAFINTDSDDFDTICKDILKNFREFKKGPHRLLLVTFTHLTHQYFCTHSFGMKMLLMFRDKLFYPFGCGINTWGREFIREAMNPENGKRVLIDVKHMSLRARKEFYDMRKKEFPDAPIVASHCGVTGCSVYNIPVHSVVMRKRILRVMKDRQRIKVKYYKLPGLCNTYFNPSTINLYDEDIIQIVNSSGMIGVSLDRRILGHGGMQKDFLSLEEYNEYYKELFNENRELEIDEDVDIDVQDEFDEDEQFNKDNVPDDATHQLYYICNNIFHIVKIGGEKAWDCICLGSDFDGIIDNVEPLPDIESYPFLEKTLLELFPLFIREAGMSENIDVPKMVRKIMYENGYEFLRRNFN